MSPLKILHLGFQDPEQPGSGGGAVRTREMARRLAVRHEVTVITAGWRGARARVEDGVRWEHAPALPGRASALTYAVSALVAARHRAADVVVEDFFAPVSTLGVPRFTTTPVVGVVQWLFAAEKARQYRLPFRHVEDWGLAQHSHLIGVSEELGGALRARAPGAVVHVVPNGVDPGLFEPHTTTRGDDVLFLGRLETAQKGLDVLLHALARSELAERGTRLCVAGDGRDGDRLRQLAAQLRLGERVVWLGRVEGVEKRRLLRSCGVVAVPSRYETFGMVAAEAMATGAPVVATDIACLREVAAGGRALLVPPGDSAALASALARVLGDPALAESMRAAGIEAAAEYDWDVLVRAQEQVLLRAVADHRARWRS